MQFGQDGLGIRFTELSYWQVQGLEQDKHPLALLDDPEAGKVLIDLLTGTKPPTEKQSATLYKAFLTYSARDYALYSDGDYYTSISEFIGSTVAGTASATVQTGADFLFSEQEQPVVIPGSMPRPVTPSQRREQILRERQQGAQ